MLASVQQQGSSFFGSNNRGSTVPTLADANLTQVKMTKYDFSIDAYQTKDAERAEVESFIKLGFEKAYGANISISMPMLLAIKNGSFKAALGIRDGNQPLFIEQYLDTSIEQSLVNHGISSKREHIVEIGHLYSNKAKFALPLLLTAGVSLFINHYRYIAFCATSQVRDLIQGAGIDLVTLAAADQNKLAATKDSWGTYYETQPKVVVISTLDIIQVINDRPKYLEMFGALSARIQRVSDKIAEWK